MYREKWGSPECDCVACKATPADDPTLVPVSRLQGRRLAITAVVCASALVLIMIGTLWAVRHV